MRHLICLLLPAALAAAEIPPAAGPATAAPVPPERAFLPDWSQGFTSALGPFWWGRSVDAGEDLRFCDAQGVPARDGTFLWGLQFNRLPLVKDDQRGLNGFALHGRNNLVVRDPGLAFQVQPWSITLNTPGAHNAKVSLGYVPADFRFQNGDNTDLEHLAPCPRIVLFMPIRHDQGAERDDPQAPYISPHYAAQSISVLEFAPGEIIHYDWFADPARLDRHILCDLVPMLPKERIRPAISKPLVRFDLTGEPGGWRVRIRFDGRAGLGAGWDVDVRSGQPGARPYTVELDPARAAWAMSLFSPGGSPADTSEVVLGLQPYRRSDDGVAAWPDRGQRIRSLPLAAAR